MRLVWFLFLSAIIPRVNATDDPGEIGVVAVGRAHGVDLAEDYSEVRWLAGGVVELGNAKGVPTPLNRAIADILALLSIGKAP